MQSALAASPIASCPIGYFKWHLELTVFFKIRSSAQLDQLFASLRCAHEVRI
jgi:hypothetical protein